MTMPTYSVTVTHPLLGYEYEDQIWADEIDIAEDIARERIADDLAVHGVKPSDVEVITSCMVPRHY